MERINKPLTKYYENSRFFLDDLKEIEVFLIENTQRITVENNEYQFANIDELANKYKDQIINKLEILSTEPYINIKFSRYGVRLYCGESDIKSHGIFSKLDSIISETCRKPEFLYSFKFYLILMVTSAIVNYSISIRSVWLTIITGLALLWGFYIAYINLFKGNQIILSEKRNMKSFFSRKKDDIFVALIGTLFAGILGIVYYLFGIN